MDSKPDPNTIIAIDFGTTNSVGYIYKNGRIEGLSSNQYNKQGVNLIPSFVEYTKYGAIVGSAAKNDFGKPMKKNGSKYVVAAVKRIIGLSYEEYEKLQDKSIFGCEIIKGQDGYPRFIIDANGNTKSPIEVASEIFKVLKQLADEYTNRKYTKAYVTVPANFKDHQCRAIKEAAKLAGLEVLKLITEPTAAAMSWCFEHSNQIKSGEKMVVYDFGGGTFDVSLLHCFGPNKFRILNTGGNPNLGGNDLDTALASFMIEKGSKYFGSDVINGIQKNKKKMNCLRHSCESAKIEFSNSIPYNEDEQQYLKENKKSYDIEMNDDNLDLTLEEFYTVLSPFIDNTITITKDTIMKQKLMVGNIKKFFLVGGSSHLHLIKQRLQKKFTRAMFPSINPDEAVAQGAMALVVNDATNKETIEEKIVISYGLQTSSNTVALILKKGDTIPAVSGEIPFSNSQDYQPTISSAIYQWTGDPSVVVEDDNDIPVVPISECTRIEVLSFKNKYPKRANEQHLTILFSLKVGGTLEVICKDKDKNEVLACKTYAAVYGGTN